MKLYQKESLLAPVPLPNGKELAAYLPDDDLVNAINLALILKRPLLLMGEPGCGKTQVAEAAAYALHGPTYYDGYFYEWYIKSTSKAKDGLYTFDVLERLRDAQIDAEKAKDLKNYYKPGVLADAFKKSQSQKERDPPVVILIDEIDKADLDFPNDLLLEMDKKVIKIEETKEEIKAGKVEPLIIITSNREKELPPAFLRRCLYHYIDFPSEERLQQILKARVEGLAVKDEDLLERIKYFIELRDKYKNENAERNLSTSELIDWMKIINRYTAFNDIDQLSKEERQLKRQTEKLEKEQIPFAQVLIKNWDAYNAYRKKIDEAQTSK